ncbi:MAG: hypothetical protein U1F34_08095 [Gammaproteobacteria bacterium]
MRSFLATIAIVVLLAIAAYFFLQRQDAKQVNSPTPAPALTPAPSPQTLSNSTSVASVPAKSLDAEARDYVRDISALTSQPIAGNQADNFVQRDQTINLVPLAETDNVTAKELRSNTALKPETPLTIIRDVDQIEIVTASKLRSKGIDPAQPLRVLENDKIIETTVGAVLSQHANDPEVPITVVKRVEQVQSTTVGELNADKTLADDAQLKLVRGRQGLESATVAELMMGSDSNTDTIYYVRTVKDTDRQGIWGIIQYGLMDNFARGIAIRRGEKFDTYRVNIPRNADERMANSGSSFLGQLIDEKTRGSHIYNLQQGRMGTNPNVIHPGQELLIIGFSPEELVNIYKHFVTHVGAS